MCVNGQLMNGVWPRLGHTHMPCCASSIHITMITTSPHTPPHLTHTPQTPTNFQRTLSTASTRSVAGSPAVSHEEELREVLVLAEAARNETLVCPLCRGVFRDPYIATCGVRGESGGSLSRGVGRGGSLCGGVGRGG